MDKVKLQKDIETKQKELDDLKSKILSEQEQIKKKNLEEQQKKLEEEKKVLEKQLEDLEKLEKDKTIDQTNKEKTQLKETLPDPDRSYELIKGSKMHDKLLTILGTEEKVEIFALDIDKVVRKYLDQELMGFDIAVINSMSVGIQFAMMETLVKQGAQGSAQFFDAFSTVKSTSSSKAFEGFYKAFGTLGSANEFYILANKVQNIIQFLVDKKNIITKSTEIPEIINPYQFKNLLNRPERSNQALIDKLDITKILTLNPSTTVDIHTGEENLKKIVNDEKIAGVITEKTIGAIQKSLTTADKFLDAREKFQGQTSELIDKIAGFLNINIPFLGSLGELTGMDFPTDILGKRKDGGLINFVLGALGFPGGLSGLHKKYIREKLDALPIEDDFIKNTFTAYKQGIDTTITHDSPTSIRKKLGLSAPDQATETTLKMKLPTDYGALKKSLADTLDTAHITPGIAAKFAPETIVTTDSGPSVDISKISNKDDFIDRYLAYIIPVLADPTDDFITSQHIDQDGFALAVIGGLVGDKYFMEAVNIGIFSPSDYLIPSSTTTLPPSSETPGDLDVINGKVDFSKGNFSPDQIKNIHLLINEMTKKNITNPYTQIGILSCIAKESGFIPKSEASYIQTDNAYIRELFGTRVTLSDTELNELKKKSPEEFDKIFFDMVYGKDATAALGRQTGNTEAGDGYKYRGRGFNGLTFKSLYKQYGDLIGKDLVANPDLVNTPEIAVQVALEFFKKGNDGKDLSTLAFTDKATATKKIADINAGGHATVHNYQRALAASEKFNIHDQVA